MRIVFIGSGNFSVPILQALSNKFDISLCITRPDKSMGRGKKMMRSSVGEKCDELGIECFTPITINSIDSIKMIEETRADIAVLASYSELLSSDVIDSFKFGIINIHPSLLPKYRGAEPIRWAIRRGETETGVSLMELSNKLDRGNILSQESIPIEFKDTEGTLRKRLVELSITMLPNVIVRYSQGYRGKPQPQRKSFYARRMNKMDEVIHWEWAAEKVDRHIRSMSPNPGCYSIHKGKRIKLFFPSIIRSKHSSHHPGEVVECKKSLIISCGKDTLSFGVIQKEGKRRITVSDYLISGQINQGDILDKVDFTR